MPTHNFKSNIWGLDPALTLEEIRRLQSEINYTEDIGYLEGRTDIAEADKRLLHRWEITSGIQTYTPRGTELEFRYYTSTGHFESSVSESRAFADNALDNLLSRDRRIFQKSAHLIFIEISGRVYSIVYGGTSAFQVRTILMGNGRAGRRREEWGRIDITLPQYSFDSDFFYWLYQKHGIGTGITTTSGVVTIRDIEGIGRFSDHRKQHNTRGRGPQSTGEISNKTALGIDQLIYESDLIIDFPRLNLVVCVDGSAYCIIDKNRTIYTDDDGVISGASGKEKEILLALYLEILPGLFEAYHTEITSSAWAPSLAIQARKKWALEVIEELCTHHNITKQQLMTSKTIP